MFRSLTGQLTLLLTFTFLVAVIALTQWYFYSSTQFANEVQQRLHLQLAEHIVHDDASLNQGVIQPDNLKKAFHTQMLLGPEWEFYALDQTGKVLAYSAPPGAVKLNSVSLAPVKAVLSGASLPVYGDDPRTPDTQKIFSASEIKDASGQVTGYLYVIIGGQELDSLISKLEGSQVLKDNLILLLATLIFALIVMALIIRAITKPLIQLSRRTHEYVARDFDNLTVPTKTPCAAKEIQDLEQSFVMAANHIKGQLAKIKTTEELRRELLSHISHDFKTPLAALNGYLETWLISPNDKRSDELIKMALKNGNQLNHLLDQLFELSRLKSGDIQFLPEPVNVVELTYDVIQGLRIQAEQQGVNLSVESQQSGLLACADISKLERILVNLIDNAIRHTGQTGQVKIRIEDKHNKVGVSVEDTGKGIPEAELQRIFEPKYQASNSEKTTQNHGLGLSIVQHLLKMHNSEIKVTSRANQGSQFSFELPVEGV